MARTPDLDKNVQQTNQELSDLQKPKKVGQKIGMGVIHDDLTKLNKTLEGKTPRAGRNPLPFSLGGEALGSPKTKEQEAFMEKLMAAAKEQHPDILEAEPVAPAETPRAGRPQREMKTVEQEPESETDEQRTARLKKIGNVIAEKTRLERGMSQNETQTGLNKTVFDKFVEQTKQREDLLKDATQEQHEIFKQLEETITKLREANSEDSEQLRKELAGLSGKLGETEDTGAKRKLQYQIDTARENARPSNLGNVVNAALGKENVLKAGYVREGNNIRNVETGKFASSKEAAHGRVASAGIKMGQFIGNKVEQFVENQRSDRFQGFLDRNVRPNQGERKSELSEILKALKDLKPAKQTRPQREVGNKSPTWSKALGNSTMAMSTLPEHHFAAAAATPEITIDNIDTLNVNAKNVNVKGGNGEEDSGDTNLFSRNGNKAAPAGGKAQPTAKGRKMPARDPKTGRFMKAKPKAKIGGKMLGIGGKALGALGVGLAGYSAYQENKDRGTGAATAIAGGTMAGALGGAAAGAAIGSVVPVAGTIVGGLIGGALGAWGAQSAGEAIADRVQAPETEQTSGTIPANAIGEKVKAQDAKIAAVPTQQGSTIAAASMANKAANKASNAPVIINNQSSAPAAAPAPSVMLPPASVRSSESAFDVYRNRRAAFV